jgi:hypothetical protein
MGKKQETGKTMYEENNFFSTVYTQGINKNKYEEMENYGLSMKKNERVPQTAFAEKHGLLTQHTN